MKIRWKKIGNTIYDGKLDGYLIRITRQEYYAPHRYSVIVNRLSQDDGPNANICQGIWYDDPVNARFITTLRAAKQKAQEFVSQLSKLELK